MTGRANKVVHTSSVIEGVHGRETGSVMRDHPCKPLQIIIS